jgi:hypothetical protein
MSSRLELGWSKCVSTICLSSAGKRRRISETLRYWPDLANSNARSIASEPVIIERSRNRSSAVDPA